MTQIIRPTHAKWARAHELHTTRRHELDRIIEECIGGLGEIAWDRNLTYPRSWSPQCSAAAAVFWLRGLLGSETLLDYFRNKGGISFDPVPFTSADITAASDIFRELGDATEMAVAADKLLARLEEGLRQ